VPGSPPASFPIRHVSEDALETEAFEIGQKGKQGNFSSTLHKYTKAIHQCKAELKLADTCPAEPPCEESASASVQEQGRNIKPDPDTCSRTLTEDLPTDFTALTEEPVTKVSLGYLLVVTCPMYGIGLSWGAQYAKATPLLQGLGISDWLLGIAWLAGPIAGIVVQPVVGDLSDRINSRLGRRRLWMWIGVTGQAAAMLAMGWSPELGRLCGDSKGSQPAALAISVAAFWLADIFLNAQQAASRTLIVDVAPPHQLAQGNGLFGLWDSIGKISGFFLGSIDTVHIFPYLTNTYAGELFADVRLVFLFSIAALVLTMLLNQTTVRERLAPCGLPAPSGGCCGAVFMPIVLAFRSIPSLPRDVRMMFATLFFLFFTWFSTWLYLPAFMGEEIYNGDPDPKLADSEPSKAAYLDGTRAYSTGMLLASCVTLVLSFVVPWLTVAFGEMSTFLAFELLHVLVLLNVNLLDEHTITIANIALLGAPFSAFLVIPYALVGRAAKATGGAGMLMATMNLFMCLPELVVSLAVGPLIAALGGSMRMPIAAATISCLVAVGIIFCNRDGWRGTCGRKILPTGLTQPVAER